MAAAGHRREAPFWVSSDGAVELGELAIDSENRTLGFPYVPSPGLLVDTLLGSLGEDLSRFCFVDFGSGKGRVLLVAAHHPFREVVGIEFSPELHEIASSNIHSYTSPARRCRNVRSVCADAASFPIPERECVLYFNNPFAEPVFARVLANIRAAHEPHPAQELRALSTARRRPGGRPHRQHRDPATGHLPPRRPVRFPTRRARLLLGSYELRIFESVD